MDDSGTGHASPQGKDGDGVRITEHDRRRLPSTLFYLTLALVLVACVAGYFVTMATHREPYQDGNLPLGDSVADVRSADGSDVASSKAATLADRQLTARPAQAPHDPNDLGNFVLPGQPAPKMAEVIGELHKAGIHSGLGAFSPPGTSPPLIGLAVPDDYVLPEGYVRHSQATDDGQRIEAILMFSPDFQFFDSAGRRIAIPLNRVVPAQLAPPGLAIRLIEIPPPLETGSPPI